MKKEDKEQKIKNYKWEIYDCKRYIEELLTKEESRKIDSERTREELKKTRESLRYYKKELDKLIRI